MADEVTYYRMKYGLSPQGASIFDALMSHDMVTPTDLKDMGVSRPYTAINRLRDTVKGVPIHARYSLGYWIDPKIKESILAEKAEWEAGSKEI